MRKVARAVYVGAAWLFLAGNLVPILVAGMALFVDRAYWDLHKELGWFSELPGLLLILVGLIAWIPRRLTAWLIAVVVLHLAHTTLPGLREQVPWLAAVHPLTAMLLAWVSLLHARRATALLLARRALVAEAAPARSVSPS